MNLIDWVGVAKNALWILGLSVVLAAVSYADWWAAARQQRRRAVLRTPLFQTPFNLGMTLFAAGLVSTSQAWWEIGAWIVLLLLFAGQTVAFWRAGRLAAAEDPPAPPALDQHPEHPLDSPNG